MYSQDASSGEGEGFVREAFALTALQLLFMQIVIGIMYFVFIEAIGIASITLDWKRVLVFALFESFQVIFSIYSFVSWYNKSYQIKSKEIIFNSGVFFANSDYYSLERLEAVKHVRSFLGMVLGFSSIKIMIHHNDKQEILYIRNIKAPQKFIQKLESALQNY